MKMLLFQARSFRWQTFSKSLPEAPDLDIEASVNHAVVAFVHVEAEDSANPKLVTKVVKYLKWLANKKEISTLVLHSFAHLATSQAPPAFARAMFDEIQVRLETVGYRVAQTPFGYSCAWDISVYGDTLAKVYKSF